MEENKNELKRKSPVGAAALVLGILSIIFASLWYISLPGGILAIIFGRKGIKQVGSKLAKAGFILGIIGLALFILVYVSITLLLISVSYY